MKVVVAGAGVFGVCIALELARRGVGVTLADPDPGGANASRIAAGMLAPVAECHFDKTPERLPLLLRARDEWPEVAQRVGIEIIRCGSMIEGEAELIEDDWRLEPTSALPLLLKAARAHGVVVRAARVEGREVGTDALVLATGYTPDQPLLTPIKGHILTLPDVRTGGPMMRFGGGYLCPSREGLRVGATMEIGRSDTKVEAAQIERLRGLLANLAPKLAYKRAVATAGVRAATPDGLPLVGRGATDGVWLAVGARRNGWLLAPIVARVLSDELLKNEPNETAFDPARFAVSSLA